MVRADDHWFCENGQLHRRRRATIHDAERIGEATTVEVLAKSSNICTAKIAAREGRERLHEILLRFGFGRPTGVDLPGERAGQIRSAAAHGAGGDGDHVVRSGTDRHAAADRGGATRRSPTAACGTSRT